MIKRSLLPSLGAPLAASGVAYAVLRKVVPGLVAIVVLAACSSDGDDATTSGCDLPQGDEKVVMDPDDFSTDITNEWWPMRPGTTWSFEERDAEGEIELITITVTDETKTIAGGIEARVVRDTARDVDGEVIEDTDDWFAQDADGNVWYLGEATAEYEDGKVASTAGSWEHGVDGALAGVVMPADPQVGCAFRQEHYKGEAEDNGRILAVGNDVVETPSGSYDDIVSTLDTTPLQPDQAEHKLYAKGIGPVMTLQTSGGTSRGVLVSLTTE